MGQKRKRIELLVKFTSFSFFAEERRRKFLRTKTLKNENAKKRKRKKNDNAKKEKENKTY